MTIQAGGAVRFTGELDPEHDALGYSDEGRVLRLFSQCGERFATVEFPAADERAGTDLVTRNVLLADLAAEAA
jgi:hypothetical protein